MEKLAIIIPAYNEEETICDVLEDWYPVVVSHDGGGETRLIVVNDGSRDGTERLLEAYAKDHPLFEFVTKENGGHGPAVRYGYACALRRGADWVFQTDSDGQTLASEFEGFWQDRENADLVIGVRRHRQDGLGRVLVSRVLRAVVKVTLGVTLLDANTPFRLMRASALKTILPRVPKNAPLANVLVAALFKRDKRRIVWKPVTFRPRQGGVNSINLRRIFKIGVQAVGDFRRIARRERRRDKEERLLK